ncbi:MAG: T9SS type A sorting domain-containing protein [Saprospiraceae bacterium]|nr:T9SS type A sorting domain-containing protein [Candidatus Vicinibacter affinis]
MKNKICIPFILTLFYCASIFSQTWQKLNGPYGLAVSASLITKDKGEIYCFVYGYASGKALYHSTNQGKSWNAISLASINASIQYVNKLLESPSGDIFLSTNNRLYKLDKTTNNWYMFPQVFTAFDYAFSPTGNKIYVASKDGLYISSDGLKFTKFQSWSLSSTELLCLGNDNNFVRQVNGTNVSIWRFSDTNGKFIGFSNSQCCRSLFFHNKSNTLFDYDKEIYSSLDYGKTWTKVSTPNNVIFKSLLELSDGTILGFGPQVYESKDNGLNWTKSQEYSYEITSTYFSNFSLSKSNNDEIVLLENNASHLIRRNTNLEILDLGLKETRIYDLKQFGQNNIYCSTDIYPQVSFDDGSSWNIIPDKNISSVLLWKDGSVGYKLNNDLVLSTDKLKTFVKKPLPTVTIGHMVLDNNENILLIDSDKVYTSSDKGGSWQLKAKNLMNPMTNKYDEVFINTQNVIYLKTYPNAEFFYSLDLGLSWTKFNPTGLDNYNTLYLTSNNTFVWESYGNFNYTIRYSSDFFKTYHEIQADKNSSLYYVDAYTNLYFFKYKDTLSVRNLINDQAIIIPFTGFKNINLESFRIYRGQNNYLYATINGNPVFKFSEVLPTDECTIQGNVFIDENLDCIKATGENKTNTFQLEAAGGGFRYFTTVSSKGDYKFIVGPGTYDLNLISKSPLWKECNFPKNFSIQAQQIINQNNILVQLTEECADLTTSLVMGRLRRCFSNNKAYIQIVNEGIISSKNTNLSVKMDPFFEKIITSINPISVSNNNYNFIIPEILPGEKILIEFSFNVSCNSSLSQEHCITSVLLNNEKCKSYNNPTLNSSVCGKNFGSWDPNYKDAIVHGISSESFVRTDDEIEYVIHFQNTGTDTAFDISITDQLDSKLIWSSIRPIDASHKFSYTLNPMGVLEIKFDNIQLPDSNVNESKSHGYFKYSIQPIQNLEPGDVIHNVADIYFDKNFPISTNDAFVKLSIATNTVGDLENSILYAIPNPAKEEVFIKLPDQFSNTKLSISILSTDSRLIRRFPFQGQSLLISRDGLVNGVYFVTVQNGNGQYATCKLVFK